MWQKISAPWWDKQTVFIIGGGPSLKGFNFGALYSKGITIGVNDSAFKARTDILFSIDYQWQTKRKNKIENFNGEKWCALAHTADRSFLSDNVNYIQRLYDRSGLPSCTDNGVEASGCGGYGALNFAVLKRAKKIVLLGFDLDARWKIQHFHAGYLWRNATHENVKYAPWIKQFEKIKNLTDALGVEVINASMKSKITAFKKCSLEDL